MGKIVSYTLLHPSTEAKNFPHLAQDSPQQSIAKDVMGTLERLYYMY